MYSPFPDCPLNDYYKSKSRTLDLYRKKKAVLKQIDWVEKHHPGSIARCTRTKKLTGKSLHLK